MVFTMLSLDDFLGMESTPNMTPMDYLLTVSKVAWYKINKQERITHNIQSALSSFPHVLDHQENSILDFVIPKGKRSMRNTRTRKFTEPFFCNGGESMIKKAVENCSDERENRVIKINWRVGVSNQEFFRLERSSQKREEGKNRVFKTNGKGSGNFAFERPLPIIRKRSRELANDNQQRFKKKAKRNIIVRVEVPPVAIVRELAIDFKKKITEIGGSLESVKLVIEKKLFDTDVKRGEGRLSIPQRQMSSKFLEPEEDAHLNTRNGDNMCEMQVMLIEPSREISKINLRKWFMNKGNGNYVLVTYWNEVVRKNDLKTGSKVQLWAFRKGTDLCFALVKLED